MPRLIITDVRLPDGSGLQLARFLKRVKPFPTIVAISGVASCDEAFQLSSLGVKAYLQKPFKRDQLLTTIRYAMSLSPDLSVVAANCVGRVPLRSALTGMRQAMIEQAFALSEGEVATTARLLRVSRQAVQQMRRQFPES